VEVLNTVRKSLLRDGIKFGSDGGVRYVNRAYCEGFGATRFAYNGTALFRRFSCVYRVANGAIWYIELRTTRDPAYGWTWFSTYDQLLQDSWGNAVSSL
jgi:hypothetical protein